MKQDRISGVAIIVGSLMIVLTMVLHPVGGHLSTDIDHLSRIASLAVAVHTLALAAIAVQIFGFLGFHRALGPGEARVRAGLVAYALGWVAVFGAALASGILGPELIRLYPDLDGPERAAMHVLWHYNGVVNQALAKVYITTTGIGTILWSLVTWRYDRWWKVASVLGLLVSVVGLLSLFTGYLRIDVTGFGLFVFGYSAWTITVGALLSRPSKTP